MNVYPYFQIDSKLLEAAQRAEELAEPQFKEIEEVQRYNQQKMLAAFIKSGVSESHFVGSTGYGYGDRGREVLDQVYATAFGAEDALVRHNFVSGTHTLTVALFGMLRPGDKMLCVTGTPYDTIQGVIGMNGREEPGSLKEFGIQYEQIELRPDGTPDLEAMEQRITPEYKMIYIQRSRGYSLRPSLRVEDIAPIVKIAKRKAPKAIVMVDNCYGEFVEREEPLAVGADIIAGSLIKNPGGGLAPTGGYICGTQECVDQCAYRLTAPGLGAELGATLGLMQSFFQGFFLAPTVTASAVKGAIFAAGVYEKLGYRCVPSSAETRHDIIQAIELRSKEAMVAFCKGVQSAAPVDSYVTPEPYPMPGYDSEVIMAAGAFVQGSSIELSADGPIREPYAIYYQGGLTWAHAKLGILMSLQKMCDAGLITLPEA